MKAICLVLFALSIACLTAAVAFAASPADALAWSVKIEGDGSNGSGTVIGHAHGASLVLTCDHVLTNDFTQPAPPVVTVDRQGVLYNARVIATDMRSDLGLLAVEDASWPSAPLLDGRLSDGEPELMIGAPFSVGLAMTTGFVGGLTDTMIGGPHKVRQGSAQAHPGNSGGGVFVQRGGWKLAGVEESILFHDGSPVPDISFFITMNDVRAFLAKNHL